MSIARRFGGGTFDTKPKQKIEMLDKSGDLGKQLHQSNNMDKSPEFKIKSKLNTIIKMSNIFR